MKRLGGLVAVTLLLLVFALVEVRTVFAQVQRRTLTYTDGSRYEGEILNGKRHGRGTYFYPNGSRYVGDWRDGMKHGQGTFIWADGSRHVGEFRNDSSQGRGTRTWPNGNRYDGDWHDWKMHGRGTFTWADGSRHVGQFRNDSCQGRGTRTWPNGNRYDGDWHDWKMHGQGTFIWADGSRHVGQFRNDDCQGRGTRTWANGNRYDGDWRDWKMHGQGTFTWADGGRHVGQFHNDKSYGRGTRAWPNGDRYEGQWLNDKMHGQGTFTWANGSRHVGEWREGKRIQTQGQQQRAVARQRQRQTQAQRQARERARERYTEQQELQQQRIRQAQQRARSRRSQGTGNQNRQVNSMELFHWFSMGLSTKTKARILELLEKGANPNIVDSAGNTPLHYAAITNFDLQTLRAVIRHGGHCDKGNVLGETPLHFAAYNHSLKATSVIETLIECGANPNRQDRRGNTPLHMVFLEVRARPNAITAPTFNILFTASSIVDLLLRHDADPNIKNVDGDTPLMSALTPQHKVRPSVIKLLLAHGADPNTRDKRGTPALMRALIAYKDLRGNAGDYQSLIVEALLSRGAKPKVRDGDGDSPLHVAAAHSSVWVIRSLLDSGADRCATNKEGYPPFAYARTSRIRGWLDGSGCANRHSVAQRTDTPAPDATLEKPRRVRPQNPRGNVADQKTSLPYGAIAYDPIPSESHRTLNPSDRYSVGLAWDRSKDRAAQVALQLCRAKRGDSCKVEEFRAPFVIAWHDGRIRVAWGSDHNRLRALTSRDRVVTPGTHHRGFRYHLLVAPHSDFPPVCNSLLVSSVVSAWQAMDRGHARKTYEAWRSCHRRHACVPPDLGWEDGERGIPYCTEARR